MKPAHQACPNTKQIKNGFRGYNLGSTCLNLAVDLWQQRLLITPIQPTNAARTGVDGGNLATFGHSDHLRFLDDAESRTIDAWWPGRQDHGTKDQETTGLPDQRTTRKPED